MHHLLNQYSLILTGILVAPMLWFIASRMLSTKSALILISALFASLFLFQQYQSVRVTKLETYNDWSVHIKSGQPILLQLYSNY